MHTFPSRLFFYIHFFWAISSLGVTVIDRLAEWIDILTLNALCMLPVYHPHFMSVRTPMRESVTIVSMIIHFYLGEVQDSFYEFTSHGRLRNPPE